MSKAIEDVLAERQRQITAEGWTAEHDDEHADGSLAMAAASYAMPDEALHYKTKKDTRDVGRSCGEEILIVDRTIVPSMWPESWAGSWWKPKDRRRDLVRAAALLLAEIERLDRAQTKAPT
jgi:hypothetical protein